MTRINLINPTMLEDSHLIAEHREIKRIPNCILQGKYSLDGQPDEYTLGTGHVKFFYDKIEFLHKRYIELYEECHRRGFNVQNYEQPFLEIKICNSELNLYNDYSPGGLALEINLERLRSKLKSMKKQPKHYGKLINEDYYGKQF